MSNILEHQRQRLEEIECIEEAISSRLQRNPHLVPDGNTNVLLPSKRQKRPWNEMMQQKHELRYLSQQMMNKGKEVKDTKESLKEEFINELDQLNDPKRTFALFDEMFQDLQSKAQAQAQAQTSTDTHSGSLAVSYLMYSSTPKSEWIQSSSSSSSTSTRKRTKKKYILSEAASHIDLNEVFAYEEGSGRYLDLRLFYSWYRDHIDNQSTYTEYLSLWWVLPYKKEKKADGYNEYVTQLYTYLIDFYRRSHPLNQIPPEVQINDHDGNDLEPVEGAKIFCGSCNKWFTKQSVYQGHLTGKKHQMNKVKQLEPIIMLLVTKYLNEERGATITHHERLPLMTDRERELERINNEGYGSEYTSVDENDEDRIDSDEELKNKNDDDDEDDDVNSKDLPIGPDGRPMPFWLYRLQGLHRSFECEICGNVSYKGRLLFEKHFNNTKHQQGLKFLGISEDKLVLFKNITLISEANDLWMQIKKQKRLDAAELEEAVEVEDNEGNVMSVKDYNDLKRQGLL